VRHATAAAGESGSVEDIVHRLRAPLTAFLILTLWLPACSSSGDHNSGAPAKPRTGGVLRIGLARPKSLDPAQARSEEELLLARQLFETLTTSDPATLQVRPGLAATWQASPDQMQWDFALRPGAVFANGRAISSADVKYSLSRIAQPSTASPGADLLSLVHGFAAFNAGQTTDLAGVTAPSPATLHIALDQPFAVLPELLASPVFGIVPKEAVEAPAPAFAQQPVGSGLFSVAARLGDRLTLRRAPGSAALLDGLDVAFYDDSTGSYRAFLAGQLDWSRVPPDQIDAAGQRYGRAQFRPYLAELFYGFNLKSPSFSDPRVREAVVHAIDRRAIVQAVYKGTVEPLDGVLVNGLSAHQDNACGDRCTFDPVRARALLAQAFPSPATPPQLAVDFDDDPTQQAVAKAIQSNLAAVGLAVTLRPKSIADYPSFAVSGQEQLFRLGWVAAYPSADAFLAPLFATGSPSNLTGLSAPEVDQALAAARREADATQRNGEYAAAERAVLAQLPVVPIAQFDLPAVVTPTVRGLATSLAGTFDASTVWLTTGRSG
jgi:oligopeptide transport system substrate-binding protein